MPSGKFLAKVSGGIDPASGRRMRVSKAFATEADARRWLRSQGAERDRGEMPFVAARGTVGDWLTEWLAEAAATTSPRTHDEYRQCIESHVRPFLGSVSMASLSGDKVAAWRDKLLASERSPGRVKRAMAYFSIAMNAAVHRGRIQKNPVAKVKRPKAKAKEVEVFSREQVRHLVAWLAGHRHEAMLRFWLDTGCRTGEVFAVRWCDFDFERGRVQIRRTVEEIGHVFREKEPKSAAGRRSIPLAPQTLAALAAWRAAETADGRGEDDGLAFPGRHGGHVSRSNWSRSWRQILAKAGLPKKKPYAVRHTSASLLLSSGVSVKAVSKRLGHEDAPVTLRIYAHLMPEDEERTVRVLSDLFSVGPQVPDGPRAKGSKVRKPQDFKGD